MWILLFSYNLSTFCKFHNVYNYESPSSVSLRKCLAIFPFYSQFTFYKNVNYSLSVLFRVFLDLSVYYNVNFIFDRCTTCCGHEIPNAPPDHTDNNRLITSDTFDSFTLIQQLCPCSARSGCW